MEKTNLVNQEHRRGKLEINLKKREKEHKEVQ